MITAFLILPLVAALSATSTHAQSDIQKQIDSLRVLQLQLKNPPSVSHTAVMSVMNGADHSNRSWNELTLKELYFDYYQIEILPSDQSGKYVLVRLPSYMNRMESASPVYQQPEKQVMLRLAYDWLLQAEQAQFKFVGSVPIDSVLYVTPEGAINFLERLAHIHGYKSSGGPTP